MELNRVLPAPRLSHCFAVRLTYSQKVIPLTFWSKLDELCEGVFAVEHADRNPHIHMAIYNSQYTHDVFRKRLVELVKECIEDLPPKGNKLMSVKAWNLNTKYIIYMLKGIRYDPCHNSMGFHECYILQLRSCWHEEQSSANIEYNAFKESEWYPKGTTITRTHDEMMAGIGGWLTMTLDIPFDTIVENAKEFAMIYLKVRAMDGTVKYMAKNLISNYCHFNKIKMRPYYI